MNDQYHFNEVASMTDVKPYVLRFWESEFEQITPTLLESGDKLYSRDDLDTIQKIKNLLFDEKMSIHEAKTSIRESDALTLQEKTEELKVSLEEAQPTKRLVSVQHIENPKKAVRLQKNETLMEKLNSCSNKLDTIITKHGW